MGFWCVVELSQEKWPHSNADKTDRAKSFVNRYLDQCYRGVSAANYLLESLKGSRANANELIKTGYRSKDDTEYEEP